ncbi:MAG: PaaI family thioesterase [Motiliproteus sp.]
MVTKQQLDQFLLREFPQSSATIDAVSELSCTVRQRIGPAQLRPGGTVSGPVLMELADVAVYVAILAEIGLVALAVTTSLNINFLRKPSAERDVIAICRLLKTGKSLVVGEVSLYSEGDEEPVAHAVATYSIPKQR